MRDEVINTNKTSGEMYEKVFLREEQEARGSSLHDAIVNYVENDKKDTTVSLIFVLDFACKHAHALKHSDTRTRTQRTRTRTHLHKCTHFMFFNDFT